MEPTRAIEGTIEEAPRAAGEVPAAASLRLLVGYDGRPGSRDALALARMLCETGEAELTVASVRPYRPGLIGADSFPMVVAEDEHWIRRGATRALGAIPFTARVLAGGHEAAGLKELAEAEGADVIVVGSTHRGRVGRVWPGTVGERVIDGAPCAVAIAPRGLADSDASIEEIAVGYDGSRASTVALREAIGLAERYRAPLLVLGAVETPAEIAPDKIKPPEESRKLTMERHLRRALETVPPGVAVHSRLLFGAPHRTLIEAAKDAGLLVLGSRSSYGVGRRLLLGTVGSAAARGSACPTLFTPAGGESL